METDTKEHEAAEPSVFEAEEQKAPKRIAKDYIVPMSDAALEEWKDKEGFAEYCAQVASGLYPTLAPQLAQGLTTKALLSPYEQMAKKYLGQDKYPFRQPGEKRVLYKIRIDKALSMG